MLVDTHAHIQTEYYEPDPIEALNEAQKSSVDKIICVGTDAKSSHQAVEFAGQHANVWAAVGLHPHDASQGTQAIDEIKKLAKKPKVVAIGECGLDYYYNHSEKPDQEQALRAQMEIAMDCGLPCIFHVRHAFDDFFKIFDAHENLKGVVHSFTADTGTLQEILRRGLYVGLNGIMTFTKSDSQLEAAKGIPLERLVLETDTPFLTPAPLRGKINKPANVKIIAEFLANLRGESINKLARATSANATSLFNLN